jgi:pantoate--beta-alanine ligase
LDIVRTIAGLRSQIAVWRKSGERIGLVPTMGALHNGHLALVRAAQTECDHVVATIFVNPKQFAPNEDLDAYPRREAADLALLRAEGVALVFMPANTEMYPPGFATTVRVAGLTDCLCGAHRAGHFDGVATVVTKLLLQSLPDTAYFGEKDYQQLVVVRRLARDLDIPVRIAGVTTVREADGLALSSRNVGSLPPSPACCGGPPPRWRRSRRRSFARPREVAPISNRPGSRSNISKSAQPTLWRRSLRRSPGPRASSLPSISAKLG